MSRATTSQSTRGDLVAAYAATGAKVLSWVVAAAVVYRTLGEAAFAVLAMTRATLGLLNYTTFGLGPAAVRVVADVREQQRRGVGFGTPSVSAEGGLKPALQPETAALAAEPIELDYSSPRRGTAAEPFTTVDVYRTLRALVLPVGGTAFFCVLAFAAAFPAVFEVWNIPDDEVGMFVLFLGIGMLLRLLGDAFGGISQGLGAVAKDQQRAAAGDALFALLLCLAAAAGMTLQLVGLLFALSGAVACISRLLLAKQTAFDASADEVDSQRPFRPIAQKLLVAGGLVTLGNAADFLYAPIDYLILNRMVYLLAPAVYAPAIQVDAAILILTTAVATVALPSAARLHAAGDLGGVWRSYLRGSLLAGGVATGAGLLAWAVSPWAFELWLGDDLPATRAILPWVLLHTVLGSAASVGRATLIAVGRPGLYACIVLAGGAINAGVSVGLVQLGWGIRGVIAGTVLSVALRCLIALPWAIRRATREHVRVNLP